MQLTAQTTSVEQLGTIQTSQATSGLGWAIDLSAEWEWQQAAAAGAKHARYTCAWGDSFGGRAGGAELQSPPPNNYSQGYQMPVACAQALTFARKYGIKPTIVAGYGPPYQQVLSVVLAADAPAGASSLQIAYTSGVGGTQLGSIQYPYDYLGATSGAKLSNAHSYAGTLITNFTPTTSDRGTVTLASALTSGLAAGSTFVINRLLYPSAASDEANDPSVRAYVGYVQFLGSQCAAAGVPCEIELWNEPSWPDDCWDNRSDCYDQNPGFNQQQNGPNWGFLAALQNTTPSPGVNYNWAGPNKSGDNSVLSPFLQQYAGVSFSQSGNPVTNQSSHPYGNNPEDNMWNFGCVTTLENTNNWGACNTIPANGSNAAEPLFRTLNLQQSNPSYQMGFSITETGFAAIEGDAIHQARYAVRQFLGYLAAGVQVIDFYDIYDCTSGFSFFNSAVDSNGNCISSPNSAPQPLPSYTAMAGLESDLASISNQPVNSYQLSSLTSVASYSGTYPLDIVHVVGSQAGATANSELVSVWQRSYSPTPGGWGFLPPTPGAPVVLNIPPGQTVSSVINLDTRASVPYQSSGQQVSFSVTDDPVGVLVSPLQNAAVSTNLTLSASGNSGGISLVARLSQSDNASHATDGENIFFFAGQSVLGYASLSGGTATLNLNSLPDGSTTILSTYGGDGHYPASASSATFAQLQSTVVGSNPAN